jgi:hypothetical protein
LLRAFLIQRVSLERPGATVVEEQWVILDLLWTLPTLLGEVAPVVRRWAESSDVRIARSARRLLERE